MDSTIIAPMLRGKPEIIRTDLAGLRVLDIGGAGYGADNPYERAMRSAWSGCARTTLDHHPGADLSVNLNETPLPVLEGSWDVVTMFDVLEHLERPLDVLRWLPGARLIVNVPNAASPIARRMERTIRSSHLYSFVPHTLDKLLRRAGWTPIRVEWVCGRWSFSARLVNIAATVFGSSWLAPGLAIHARRSSAEDAAAEPREDHIASAA
ncbi:MAG: hypothetical protein KBA51_01330, partial [Kiritimatiellae bacterium]|nr:hypothetical protein [Kiritimatiellia bacterium]